MKLVSLSLSWILGIYLGSLTPSPLFLSLVSAFLVASLVVLAWRRRDAALWGVLCFVVLVGGIGCYQWRVNEPTLEPFNNIGVIEVRGEVIKDPEFDDGIAKITFSAQEICSADQWEDVSGTILIETKVLPTCSLGELLEVKGELRPISEVEDQEYVIYLKRHGFCSVLYYPEAITSLGRGWLYDLRYRLSHSLSSALVEPQASLAEALLLGIRSHIPESLGSDFYRTGTAHLLAISGFNVAIFGGMVLVGAAWVFGRRRPTYLLAALISIWFYALLTGMQPPVLRAAIMFSLFLLSWWLGRPDTGVPSLAFAAAIMVGINPSVLWDVSFQLSFAAVAGLMLFFPVFRQWGRRILLSEPHALSSALKPIIDGTAIGLAAVVATLPLSVYYFGSVSLLALPATIVLSLFLPAALLLSALTALLGLFAPTLAWCASWPAWFFLSCITEVLGGLGSVEAASVSIRPVDGAFVWVYYAVLAAILLRRHIVMVISSLRTQARRWLAGFAEITGRFPKKAALTVLVVFSSLVWMAVLAMPDERLEVSFLDVGQGDAILIETPAGQQILIDGGPDIDSACHRLGDKLPYWDKSLDLVVLTHPHDDHLIGLAEVLRRYEVGQVLQPAQSENTPAYEGWLELLEEKGIEPTVAKAGQRIDLGDGIVIEVFHPQDEMLWGTESDANNNSVVLRLVWRKISFLFAGDIDEEAEMAILYGNQWFDLESTVLKVAHHGSSSATSCRFLAGVEPQIAVLSVGENNYFGHPSEEVLARLEGVDIYRTDESGTISFTTDGERLWVVTER